MDGEPRWRRWRCRVTTLRPTWLGVGGIVIGGIVVGVLTVLGAAALFGGGSESGSSGRPVVPAFPAVEHDADDAEMLIEAWERWRTATFVSVGTWSRTSDGAASPLEGEVYTAQDPPRRLVIRLGAVVEQVDGGVVTCDAPTEDLIVPDCTESSATNSYEDRVAAEMSLVQRYVRGGNRIYDVDEVDGCYLVELRVAALRSPWGRAAEFCFDEDSGALQSSRVRRQSATDVETTSDIRTSVTPADF